MNKKKIFYVHVNEIKSIMWTKMEKKKKKKKKKAMNVSVITPYVYLLVKTLKKIDSSEKKTTKLRGAYKEKKGMKCTHKNENILTIL
ncbi:hypothetical protein POVCU2_0040530 [Plasmodium ovale curtisi]|nr:hypothetical protein POVCU2_0040530 [Plasmodium ovale curtisi]